MHTDERIGRRRVLIIITLAVVLAAAVIISFALGRYPISVRELFGITWSKLLDIEFLGFSLSNIFTAEKFWSDTVEAVYLNVRLPRILLACLVGCCLSAAGASYQGIFQNPMAAPDVLGATAGAAFGAALAIFTYSGRGIVTVSAFLFSLLSVLLVFVLSKKVRGKKIVGLVLTGIMVKSLFSAATSLIKLMADPNDQLPAITYWLMGSLQGARMSDIKFVIIPMILGLVPLILLRWRLTVVTLGDEEARTVGVNAGRMRVVVMFCATLLTAASVSVSGSVEWVGLVIPHLSRRLVGNDYRYLLPTSMLFGAIFLLLVDNVSRNLFTMEVPLSILTAFIGAPFFIYLITRGGDGV